MIIQRDVSKYVIHSDISLQAALQAIDQTTEGFVLCLNNDGVLEGVLTDGDIRRWLLKQTVVNLSCPVSGLLHGEFTCARITDSRERIAACLNKRIRFVPLLDDRQRLVGIARQRDGAAMMRLGDHSIGEGAPVFVIAEIGINHNGSIDRARRLIDAVAAAGADCAKFQMRHLKSLYRTTAAHATGEDLGVQYTLGLLDRFELPVEEMIKLFDHTRECGLTPLCTPWEEQSLAVLEAYGKLPGYKVASADLTNHRLLTALARTYKPLILSTGMSDEEEIRQAVAVLKNLGAAYALLHCNSTYPTPFKDINLDYLPRLKEIGDCPVGYSGHERGLYVAIAAVVKGARIIEKHITEDRSLEGTDHKVSLLPKEFASLVEGIRQVEEAMGNPGHRTITQGEMANRVSLAKSLVVTCELKAGSIIEDNMIEVRSPGRGLQPNRRAQLIGRHIRRDMQSGDFFFASDLEAPVAQPRPYHFTRPWGLTVRWHDFQAMLPLSNPDFLEFHLSFKDMEEDYMAYFKKPLDLDLKVHSPDTFPGDHLLDLSNADPQHRRQSIQHLQRVIDLTRALKPWFRKASKPVIIASLGGFTTDAPLGAAEVKTRYALMADSLSQLDRKGVEIVGQTLPPFPWYFGGQLYLNLFVHAGDTAQFCKDNALRLCLDVCHTRLAANHFGNSFKAMIDQLAPYTAHLHMADARGVDGEGLQIGEGDIDFPALTDHLLKQCPMASFIPEIWQGHKNNGEGFWMALERLEAMGF